MFALYFRDAQPLKMYGIIVPVSHRRINIELNKK